MRFTSLIVELVRARPRLVFFVAAGLHALLWLLAALLFFDGPPGNLAQTLAVGREYLIGTAFGPPLAYWLADLAYRVAFGHLVGVYLLAQLCSFATFYALFLLGRSIMGGPRAVVAVLLTMTVTSFGAPVLAFGPDVVAQPLYAVLLYVGWRAIGLGQPRAWPAAGLLLGLLILTTPFAGWALVLLVAFALVSSRGRRSLMHWDALVGLMVMVIVALPYLIWVGRTYDVARSLASLQAHALALAQNWAAALGWLLLPAAGLLILTLLNLRRGGSAADEPSVISRAPIDPPGRAFIAWFAILPILAVSAQAAISGVQVAAGTALLLTGLAAVGLGQDGLALRREVLQRQVWVAAVLLPLVLVAGGALVLPWFGASDPRSNLPAGDIGRFFAASYERRIGKPLEVVAGDLQLAALVAMIAPRPHLLLDATPELTPWASAADMAVTGGLVLWRAQDTVGAPPADLLARFPGLVPELPRVFDRIVNGREPVLRIGWGIIRPTATSAH